MSLSLILVNGGWREEVTPHLCSTYANGTRIETRNVTKFCDDPTPEGGDLCHCNTTDPNEQSCDGMVARIHLPCRKGKLFQKLSYVAKLKNLFIPFEIISDIIPTLKTETNEDNQILR